MPNSNAIVARIARVEPALDKPPADGSSEEWGARLRLIRAIDDCQAEHAREPLSFELEYVQVSPVPRDRWAGPRSTSLARPSSGNRACCRTATRWLRRSWD